VSDILRLRMARAPQRLEHTSVARWTPDASAGDNSPAHASTSLRARMRDAARNVLDRSATFLERLLASPAAAGRKAQAFSEGEDFVGRGAPVAVPVRELDRWLIEHDNRPLPKALVIAVQRLAANPLDALVASGAWQAERQRVFDSLLAVIVARLEPGVGSELTRLLLIFALVEDLARSPSPIKDADDVEQALRYRTVLIPKEIERLVPNHARLARRYGFADLYVVRDEWNRYEAGELAHIENVLAHEEKHRLLKTLSETEVLTSEQTETSSLEEHDSQTTDRLELQQHAQNETDLAVHVAAQVEVEASYGPVHIAATAGGSFDYSQKQADEQAYQQSREVVSRTVTRVEERVKTTRATRALHRTTQEDRHALNNKDTANVVGMYRWVDKVQRLQLFKYPHRLLLEFQLPEPAAFVRWRRSQPRGGVMTPDPVPLVRRDQNFQPILDSRGNTQPLQPNDVTERNYQSWVAQYNVMGVAPPPEERVQVRAVLELAEQVPSGGGGASTNTVDESAYDKTYFDLIGPGTGGSEQPGVAVPAGYRLESWDVSGYATNVTLLFGDKSWARFLPNVNVMVGDKSINLASTQGEDVKNLVSVNPWGQTIQPFQTWVYSDRMPAGNYPAASPVTGMLQVSALVTTTRECRLHVTLNCLRMAPALTRWQQQTYEQIAAAYWGLKRQHADELAAQAVGKGVAIEGDPPARNKEVILEELKRGVIEMLTGQSFSGRNGMASVTVGLPPQVDLDQAVRIGEEIQFLEQAFEWENLTYVLYPYFWADSHRWTELADMTGADPEFARFLRSGSARVVVPARPKFEDQVRTFVDLGILWGGGPAPTVDDPEYLSVAAEIMAQQTPPEDGIKGKSWEVRLPTTLVWLDSAPSLPKVNPTPLLDAPPPPAPALGAGP
jgi:hypothetical protein